MYYKNIDNGYISSVSTGHGQFEITKSEYNKLLDVIYTAPVAEEGFVYKLRADTLEWELVELPEIPEEEPEQPDNTPAWDISQGEYIPVGFVLTRDGVSYECIQGHYAAWSKQPPNAEYWRSV